MSMRYLTVLLLLLGLAAPAFGATLDAPTVTPLGADRTSITLEVEAGASGAPGGFVVEWLPLSQYQSLGGWPGDPGVLSGSSFTGVPTLTVTPGTTSFRLDPGAVADVVLGRLFDETGVTAADREELVEGTDYVVRVRAAASPGYEESPNSATVTATTVAQGPYDCTLSSGYWKNHPGNWSLVSSMVLGTVTYSNGDLQSILDLSAKGNGLVSLAHQLIAAKLNVLLGASPPASVSTAIGQADALIGAKIVPPLGAGSLSPSQVGALVSTLTSFNAGTLGPGHCPGDAVATHPSTWGRLKAIYR